MLDALIVGAGPTGLTMAAQLLRHGLTIRLIDKALTPPADASRALVVHARTLEIFHFMGIVEAARDRSVNTHGFNLVSTSGQRKRIPLQLLSQLETPYPEMRMLPQHDTETLLREKVEALHGNVERGVELLSSIQAPECVRATLRRADATEEVEARYLIGCDGSRSAVREQAGIAFEGDTYDDHCMVGDVFLDWALPDNELYLFPGPHGITVAFPMPEPRRFRLVAVQPTAPAQKRELSIEEFSAPLRQLIPIPFTITGSHFLSRYRLHHRVAARFRHQRAFIAGDAAHVHSPVGGQGMNTGIHDATNLAWKLALVVHGQASASILDTYESERRPIARHLVEFTDRGFAMASGATPLSSLLRRVAPSLMPQAMAIPPVQRRMIGFISQLRVRYHTSPVASEISRDSGVDPHPFYKGPAAGARAPDFTVQGEGRPTRLFDLLRTPRHVLVLFAGELQGAADPDSLIKVAQQLNTTFGDLLHCLVITRHPHEAPAPAHLDPGGEAHARYFCTEPAAYLIRPDGYIGFRSHGIDQAVVESAVRARIFAPGGEAAQAETRRAR